MCGTGYVEWENRSTGEIEQKYKISIKNEKVGLGLPDTYPCDDHVVLDGGGFIMGTQVILTIKPNRYKQMHVVEISRVDKEAH